MAADAALPPRRDVRLREPRGLVRLSGPGSFLVHGPRRDLLGAVLRRSPLEKRALMCSYWLARFVPFSTPRGGMAYPPLPMLIGARWMPTPQAQTCGFRATSRRVSGTRQPRRGRRRDVHRWRRSCSDHHHPAPGLALLDGEEGSPAPSPASAFSIVTRVPPPSSATSTVDMRERISSEPKPSVRVSTWGSPAAGVLDDDLDASVVEAARCTRAVSGSRACSIGVRARLPGASTISSASARSAGAPLEPRASASRTTSSEPASLRMRARTAAVPPRTRAGPATRCRRPALCRRRSPRGRARRGVRGRAAPRHRLAAAARGPRRSTPAALDEAVRVEDEDAPRGQLDHTLGVPAATPCRAGGLDRPRGARLGRRSRRPTAADARRRCTGTRAREGRPPRTARSRTPSRAPPPRAGRAAQRRRGLHAIERERPQPVPELRHRRGRLDALPHDVTDDDARASRR